MPPIKPMGPEDEIIAHIKSSLIGHEEEYIPGAWEKFDKKQNKNKRLIVWLGSLSGVAAMLLIGVFLFFRETPTDLRQTITKNKTDVAVENEDHSFNKTRESALPNPLDINARSSNTIVKQSNSKNEFPSIGSQSSDINGPSSGYKQQIKAQQNLNNITSSLSTVPIVENEGVMAMITNSKKDVTTTREVISTKEVIAQAIEKEKKLSFQDFLTQETRRNKTEPSSKATKTNNKWEMGLVVAPSFSNNKKLNMGYGVSMGYNLSERVSLNSGISYNDMAASSSTFASAGSASPSNSASFSSIASTSKSLESVEAKVSGIDIPLEIKYNLTKKLYANVGVSAFAVISQSRNNNYLQGTLVESAPNTTTFSELKTLQTERVSEEVPESEINTSNYIGFYNFSFGFRQKISKKNTFSIEPFMKVPMKSATTENLRLIGTGVKLKFDF